MQFLPLCGESLKADFAHSDGVALGGGIFRTGGTGGGKWCEVV